MSDLCLAGASHWAPFDSRRRQTARRRALRVLRTWRRELNAGEALRDIRLDYGVGRSGFGSMVEVAPFGEQDGKTVYALALAGDIKAGDDLRVASLLGKALVEDRFPGFMVLSSNGGNTNASLGIARIAHDYGMPVLVRVECLSGCAIIALSALAWTALCCRIMAPSAFTSLGSARIPRRLSRPLRQRRGSLEHYELTACPGGSSRE